MTIEIYNTENDQPIESMISTEFDTSDEDQQVEKNPDDDDTSNVAGSKNIEEGQKDD